MFEHGAKIAVAVSGGPDSMALLHLLRSVSKNIIALTVDHGLRAESAAEAKAVAAWCKKQKIEHHVLSWQGKKPKTGLHEAARVARYELLQNWCRAHKILHLATAHHADDQAETVLQRIAKASGPQGLGGMAEHAYLPHLHVWRPLLRHPKSDLVRYCTMKKIPFAEDASNDNPKFARGRLRSATDVLAVEGLTAQNLNLFAEKQRAAATAISDQAAEFLAQHACLLPKETIIAQCAFQTLPDATAECALDYVLKLTSNVDAPIRGGSLRDLREQMRAPVFRARTLGHCRIVQKKNLIIISPE